MGNKSTSYWPIAWNEMAELGSENTFLKMRCEMALWIQRYGDWQIPKISQV